MSDLLATFFSQVRLLHENPSVLHTTLHFHFIAGGKGHQTFYCPSVDPNRGRAHASLVGPYSLKESLDRLEMFFI